MIFNLLISLNSLICLLKIQTFQHKTELKNNTNDLRSSDNAAHCLKHLSYYITLKHTVCFKNIRKHTLQAIVHAVNILKNSMSNTACHFTENSIMKTPTYSIYFQQLKNILGSVQAQSSELVTFCHVDCHKNLCIHYFLFLQRAKIIIVIVKYLKQ